MGARFSCYELLEKLLRTAQLMGDTIVYLSDSGNVSCGGKALNDIDKDERSRKIVADNSASDNSAMVELLCDIKYHIDNHGSFGFQKDAELYTRLENAVEAQLNQ